MGLVQESNYIRYNMVVERKFKEVGPGSGCGVSVAYIRITWAWPITIL